MTAAQGKSTTAAAPVQDLHVLGTTPLISPRQLKADLPLDEASSRVVIAARDAMKHILLGQDKRTLVIVGPCSIHDEKAALDYAARLTELHEKYADKLLIVMRVYFEKPRTTVGWKGLVYDPKLDDSLDLAGGLRLARRILLAVTKLGLPTATEFLDPIVPQYIDDLVSWAAIGARTTESQTHRQMASGLSMPVGYKNNTTGDIQPAINAMLSAKAPHSFLGIDGDGRISIVNTTGNRWGHIILRGGEKKPNYDPETVADAIARLSKAKLPAYVMVDCSHANSHKKHDQQEVVWRSVIEQRRAGNDALFGLMLESNINSGRQDLTADLSQLKYGVSITDECIGWAKTEELLAEAHAAL
jgi:3-deoxy-7-phosphoheptulonate synthase